MENTPAKVAVIGLGALGIVTLKNLAEEGFNVTGFERNGQVGGLWQYSTDDRTSVLPTTIVNISKERGCFTDFPFPEDTPSLCPAARVQSYLESYADHFALRDKMRLNTNVTRVSRDEDAGKWVVEIDGERRELFDKIVLATGINQLPHVPTISGLEKFTGQTLHSRAFKRPENFKGKVLVVGLGNTGADTAVALVGHANKIYLSHRHGTTILPRTREGRSIDHTLTLRFLTVQRVMATLFPSLTEKLFNAFAKKLQDGAFNIRPEWHFSPAPSLKYSVPIISDELVPVLEKGAVESVAGIDRVVGPREVQLTDGRRLEVDTIIFCTGYVTKFTVIEPQFDPMQKPPAAWTASSGSRGKPLPRLYRNIFPPQHSDSLAFMGCVAFSTAAFQLYDLASMAVAQVWKGTSALPTPAEMERAVDEHQAWVCASANRGPVFPGMVKPHEWMDWANDTAGTGVAEKLGWGWQGWKFWLTEPKLCSLLMSGVYSPHIYRLFDGKRKKWPDAREEIERVNERLRAKPKTA